MRSALRIRLLAIRFVIASIPLPASSDPVHLNESEMSAVVADKEIDLVVPVSNDSGKSGSGTLHVDLIDPADVVIVSSEETQQFNPGRNSISLRLTRVIAKSFRNGEDPVLWYRVRYRLLFDGKPVAKGIVALGAIAPDMFELLQSRGPSRTAACGF